MAVHAWWSTVSAGLWPVVANHLWQSTLFAVALIAIAAMLRDAPARLRHLLWLLALAKFAVPASLVGAMVAPLVRTTAAWVAPAAEASLPAVLADFAVPVAASPRVWPEPQTDTAVATAPAARHAEWACVLTALWAAVAGLLLLRWKARLRVSMRVLESAHPAGARERAVLEAAAARHGLTRGVALLTGPDVASPGVWGVWRPVVALPEGLAASVSDEELEAVLLHELVHVRRCDNLVAALQMVLCCLFWFHPLVWVLDRRLLAERELACDEHVVATRGEPRTYAEGLLKVVRFCLGWRAAGVSYAANRDLKRRIQRMMTGVPDLRLRRAHRLALMMAVAIFVFGSAGAVLLASARQAAREQFERRGRCLADNLAFNSTFGVLIEDQTELDKLLQGVRESTPGVVGIAILGAKGRPLAVAGDTGPVAEGVTLFRAPVIDALRDGYKGRGASDVSEPRGEVFLALRQEGRSAREEMRLRGEAITRGLAFNVSFGVLIEDRTELNRLLDGVAESAPDVAGIVVRGAQGRVLASRGESWTMKGTRAIAGDGTRVVLFRAPVIDGKRPPKETYTVFGRTVPASPDGVRGEVQVALRDVD